MSGVYRRGAACGLVMLAGSAAATAQEDALPVLPPAQDVPEAILSHLTADRFVEAGAGFREVRIGQPLDHALQAWGPPERTGSRGLLRRTQYWEYRLEENTLVTLIGRQRVEAIRIDGGIGSTVETTRGTRFGMAPYEVAAAYGAAPGSRSGGPMEYAARGIRFEFSGGQMKRMEVFPPQRTR